MRKQLICPSHQDVIIENSQCYKCRIKNLEIEKDELTETNKMLLDSLEGIEAYILNQCETGKKLSQPALLGFVKKAIKRAGQ